MNIYLDVCCLCRPFDNQTVPRISIETKAVVAILSRCSWDWNLVDSRVLRYEIEKISDDRKRDVIEKMLMTAREYVAYDKKILGRAEELEKAGIKGLDSLHLACAERVGAVFLTTDSRLVKIMMRNEDRYSIPVDNPVSWLMEVNDDENKNAL